MADDSSTALRFEVIPGGELDGRALAEILALFHASYAAPRDTYVIESLSRLRFVATARAGETLAGFALGEARIMDLPRLPAQAVALAGICCVDPRFRRRGLFRELERRAFAASGVRAAPRLLACGRVAHPASFRPMTGNPTHVPRRGVRPTAWQREVGAAIAAAYGVQRFDPETFVCIGGGQPMRPIVDVDVRPEEWKVFAAVDRGRGDALLGLCWTPDAPAGW